MSHDVFIQVFLGGESSSLRFQAVRALIDPFVIEETPGFALLQTPDGGADILGYGDDGGLAVVGADGKEIWDLIVAIAQVTGAVIIPTAGHPLVVDTATIGELPEEMRAMVELVTTGKELMAALGVEEWPTN